MPGRAAFALSALLREMATTPGRVANVLTVARPGMLNTHGKGAIAAHAGKRGTSIIFGRGVGVSVVTARASINGKGAGACVAEPCEMTAISGLRAEPRVNVKNARRAENTLLQAVDAACVGKPETPNTIGTAVSVVSAAWYAILITLG